MENGKSASEIQSRKVDEGETQEAGLIRTEGATVRILCVPEYGEWMTIFANIDGLLHDVKACTLV